MLMKQFIFEIRFVQLCSYIFFSLLSHCFGGVLYAIRVHRCTMLQTTVSSKELVFRFNPLALIGNIGN